MCGIFGGFGFDKLSNEKIIKLQTSMQHRGPDSFNYVYISHSKLSLAHSRLTVIDKSPLANQPMIDTSTGNNIVFNGEIYNYREIKQELINLGHIFNNDSDTEVLLKGYLEWNINILNKINGMFAFAIWDNVCKRLIIARDRLGEKPLYYFNPKPNLFYFSSELKPLCSIDLLSSSINTASLSHYFSHGYMPHESSIFDGVKKLKPAHYMIIDNGNIKSCECYWNLKNFYLNKNYSISFNESIDQVNHLLKLSTSAQQVSDVPLGVFLSGGVDSSLVAAAIGNRNFKLDSFCAGFSDTSFDERNNASDVAHKLSLNHKSFEIGDFSFSEILKPYELLDEPFSDTSSIPTYYLANFARKYCTVCLSGDGGDELFGGYSTYSADLIHNLTSFLPRSFFKLGSNFASLIPATLSKASFDYKLKSFLNFAQFDFEMAHDSWRSIFHSSCIPMILSPTVAKVAPLRYEESEDYTFWNDLPEAHFLDRAMYYDLNTWLPNDILFKVDRLCMLNSLESRAPFLDYRLVEFSASLPVKFKINLFNTKILLKKLGKSKYGIDFSGKKKLGFSSPTSKWFLIHQKIIKEYLLDSKCFNTCFVETLVSDHTSLKMDNGYRITNLMAFVAWKNSLTIN